MKRALIVAVLILGLQNVLTFAFPIKNAFLSPKVPDRGVVLGAESGVGGTDMTQPALSSDNVPVNNSKHNTQNSKVVYDRNNDWRSPNFLWSRRDTGLAAAASLIAGPLLLQREAMLPIATTTSTFTPASTSAAASVALEAGDALIRNIWLGRLAYPTLIVALEMGLFEALKDRPLSFDQLGRKLQPKLDGTSRALEAVTSVLLSLGLVQWSDHQHRITGLEATGGNSVNDIQNRRISLTDPARAVLLEDSPYFWGAQLLAADGVTATLRRRIQLESRNAESESSIVAYESHSDQVIDSFIDSMQSHSAVTAEATAKALESVLPASGARLLNVLDMAGGSGCFALALAKRYSNVKVTLADLPNVVASWKRRHQGAKASVVQRIDAVSANLFDVSTWPRDIEVILLANVLHDWGQAQVLDILRNSHVALTSVSNNGMVIIVEQLMNQERNGPLPVALASISMLLGDWRTGKQYTLSELSEIAAKAGFRCVELGPPCGPFHQAVICHI